jgi:hypothetical protein
MSRARGRSRRAPLSVLATESPLARRLARLQTALDADPGALTRPRGVIMIGEHARRDRPLGPLQISPYASVMCFIGLSPREERQALIRLRKDPRFMQPPPSPPTAAVLLSESTTESLEHAARHLGGEILTPNRN